MAGLVYFGGIGCSFWVKISSMIIRCLRQVLASGEGKEKEGGCMARKLMQLGSTMSALVLFSAPVSALPFAPIEPQSFAQGGTGVSSASNASAGFLNPALLAINEPKEAVVLYAPVIGFRYFDRQNVLDALISYQDIGIETLYDAELNILINEDPGLSLPTIAALAAGIRSRFSGLANKPVQQEFMGAIVVGVEYDKLNMTFSLGTKMLGGALIDITEQDLAELDRMVTEAGSGELSSATAFASSQFGSRLRGRGLITSEFALSMARNVTLAGHEIAVGITPRFIQATSFDYVERINNADFKTTRGRSNDSTSAFDVDVGAAKRYGNGWRAGVAIKNLIGQRYVTSLGNEIRIKPQARVGVSHAMKWSTVAMDFDLNKSESLGFDSPTQYLAIGAELNVFDMSIIRVGYRANMSDPGTSVATVGLGVKVYGMQVDLAAGANEDEIDFAASLGYQF